MQKIKKKLSWKFFSARRGMTLQHFIRNANTLQEALEIFDKQKLEPPEHSEIEAVLSTRKNAEPKISQEEITALQPEFKESLKKKSKKKFQEEALESDAASESQEQEIFETNDFPSLAVAEDEQPS